MARILVVDDEKSVRVFLREFLKAEGHEISTAENATLALELIKQEPFDVVVTDIVMPRVTGVELLRQVKQLSPHSKVVMITGDPNLETAVEAVRSGAFDYVSKPVGKREIVQVVSRAVELKELEDEKRRLEEENLRHREHLEELVEERTKALLETEERLRHLGKAVESSSDAIGIASPTGSIIFLNQAFVELSGYTKEEIMQRGGIPSLYTDNATAKEMLSTVKAGESWAGELEIITRAGTMVPVELRADAIKDEDGKLIGLVGMHSDISERRVAAEALEASEELYRSLVENAPTGIISVDAQGNILSVNPKILGILGSPSAEATKAINLFQFPPLIESGIVGDFKQCMEENRPMSSEQRYISKWGANRHLHYHLTPLNDASGKVSGVLANVVDISARMEAQAALEESEEKYRGLVERARDGVYILQDQHFVYVNDAFCKISGYSREELLKMEDFIPLVAEESRSFIEARDRKMEAGEKLPHHYEFVGRTRKGRAIYLEASTTPIIYKGVPARQGWVQDITQRREHEEQLTNVITNTSHLINTPLTVALGYMDLVSQGHKDMTPELAGMVYNKLMMIRELVIDGLTRNNALLTERTSDGLTPVRQEEKVNRKGV